MSSNNKYQKILLYSPVILWILILLYIIHAAFSILIPFIAGGIIAYICSPLSKKLTQTAKIPKVIAASIIVFLIYFLIAAVVWLVVPIVYKQLTDIIQTISLINPENLMEKITSNTTLRDLYETEIGKYAIQLTREFKNNIATTIPGYVNAILSSVVTSTHTFLIAIFNIVFTPLSFFLYYT